MEFAELVIESVATWHNISPPNDPARRLAADLEASLRAFEKVRDTDMRFEDEPASFESALQATKYQGDAA